MTGWCRFFPLVLAALPLICRGQTTSIPLVDIQAVDPAIVIDLRYASADNITHHPIYPPGTRALTRPEVARRLIAAERFLRQRECTLKIWDAYRPRSAQVALWNASPKNDYVANPEAGAGSLHSWGLAVDATLGGRFGQSVQMPTDFDDFTAAAMWKYLGNSQLIRHHLLMLQMAMREAGFLGLRTEWWHFTTKEWQQLMPPDEAKKAAQAFGDAAQRKL
jgi:D-alanyl-D-alanine dipeptidase